MQKLLLLLFLSLSLSSQANADKAYNLGKLYQEEKPYNYRKAVDQYMFAGTRGNVDAQFRAGYLFRIGGYFLEKDLDKAKIWLQQAATNGRAEAQYYLAQVYELENDCYHPFRLLNQAAEQDFPAAQFRLGKIFEQGICTAVDYGMAKMWYQKAADNGYPLAASTLGRLNQLIEKRKSKKQLEAEKLHKQKILWGTLAGGAIFIWILIYILGEGKREREKQLRMDELARIADRKKKEDERIQKEKDDEKERLRQLVLKEEEKRIYALQQKKLVYLKADKYLSEFESHLPFKLSAIYSDLRVFYDKESSTTQTSFIENQTSFKDGKLWNALISLLVDDHSLDTMSTIYFAKIRSLLDDENYLVIGETDLDIIEFFDRSTQLELVDLISNCLMPKPIALFVILHLSREFRYPNEEERAETEFKLEHFIVKENAKVKIQKLFTKFDEYAIKCVDSYADISSKEYDELESDEFSD